MEREISTERQILSHLRNGEGWGEEVRKYFSMFMMIDDGRPSLLPANRPSVRPTTAARSNLFGLHASLLREERALKAKN